MNLIILFAFALSLSANASEGNGVVPGSDRYKVESCECVLKKGVNEMKPWELPWDNSKAMRQLIDGCTCQLKLNLDKIEDFHSILVPKNKGLVIRGAQ